MKEQVLAIEREGRSGVLTEYGRVDLLVDLSRDSGTFTISVRAVAGSYAAIMERTGDLAAVIPWLPITARKIGFALDIPKWAPIQVALERDFIPKLRAYERSLLRPAPASRPATVSQ